MLHGAISSAADVHGKAIRVGTVTVTALDLTKAVTFSSAMPNSSYEVFFSPKANLAVTLYPSSHATSGFTLNLSIGVVGTISYIAVET